MSASLIDIGPHAWSAEAIRADPVGFVVMRERSLRRLSDMLERIADGLPSLACPSCAAVSAARLRLIAEGGPGSQAGAFAVEEALYALVAADPQAGAQSAAYQVIRFARRESDDVAGLAAELADALDALVRTGVAERPEALGFTLRACFGALRRRLDWVEEVIMPVARSGGEAVAAMGARLVEGMRPQFRRAAPLRRAWAGEALGASSGGTDASH